jgi:thiamine phosphate synthase YjbQ (UPF0047 family)
MIRDRVRIGDFMDAYRMVRVDEVLNQAVSRHGLEKGVIRITAPRGCLLTTIEYEPGLVEDFIDSWHRFDRDVKPATSSEVLGKLVSNTLHLPFNLGRLVIGDLQQVALFATEQTGELFLELEFVPTNSILGLESIETNAEMQTLDITDIVERTLMNVRECQVTMISPDPCVILYTLDPFRFHDLTDFLKRVAPRDAIYRHNHQWVGNAGFIHVRAAYFSQALTVKVENGHLSIGGERLFFTELDTRGTKRDIYFEIWK